MNKQIFILNGTAGVGKDTFADLLNQYIPTKHISSITPVKQAAQALGWDGSKTDTARSFLCELKKFVNSQGEYIWEYLDKQVEEFKSDNETRILLIDIREPDEIRKAVERYGAKTILIRGHFLSTVIASNSADKNVNQYKYDHTFFNVGTIDNFSEIVKDFANRLKPKPKLEGKVIAVDFDDTIARTNYPTIIEPIDYVIRFLRKAKKNGATIILWTCREGEVLDEAVEWCKQNDVPIDLVNENSPARCKIWGNDSRKIGADLYIDDKSFNPRYENNYEFAVKYDDLDKLIDRLAEEDN